MDTLKKVAIVVGIVAGAATIVVAVVAVVTLMMNVATKDDISDLKEQMTTQMTTGFEQVSREISGLRTDVDQKNFRHQDGCSHKRSKSRQSSFKAQREWRQWKASLGWRVFSKAETDLP